jgi:5-methylcytosine-specific restriction endonuclease McrA
MNTLLKHCAQCGNDYPATTSYFHADKTRPDGLHSYCKPCRKQRAHSLYAANPDIFHDKYLANYAANRDKMLAKNREWAAANPEKRRELHRRWIEANRERHNEMVRQSKKRHWVKQVAYARKWRAENAEHYRAYEREYRNSIREKVRENARRARQRDPLRYRAYVANYSAKRREGPGVTKGDILAQYEKQQGRCFWCSASVADSYHVDHVIPLSRHGSHSPDNIVIACPTCNISKNDKLPFVEWTPPNPLEPRSDIN